MKSCNAISGERNENSEKTTIGLISKKALCSCSTLFFVHFFAVVLHDCNVNIPETSSLQVLWRKCRTFCSLVLLPLTLVAASIFIFSPSLKNFHVVLPKKKCLLCFWSLTVALCRSFSRWASLACRLLSLFSLFLFLYHPNLWAWQII